MLETKLVGSRKCTEIKFKRNMLFWESLKKSISLSHGIVTNLTMSSSSWSGIHSTLCRQWSVWDRHHWNSWEEDESWQEFVHIIVMWEWINHHIIIIDSLLDCEGTLLIHRKWEQGPSGLAMNFTKNTKSFHLLSYIHFPSSASLLSNCCKKHPPGSIKAGLRSRSVWLICSLWV